MFVLGLKVLYKLTLVIELVGLAFDVEQSAARVVLIVDDLASGRSWVI